MAGPWVSLKSDPEFAVITRWTEGSVIEIKCVDDDGKHMGNALLVTESRLRTRLFCCYLVAASDKDYNTWMRTEDGHPNPGYYRQGIGTIEDKDIKYRKENVVLVKEWRHICQSNGLMDLGAIKWIPKNKIASHTKVIIERMETLLEKKQKEPRERSKTPPDRNRKKSKTPPRDRGSRATLLTGPRHDSEGFQDELDALRKSVERDPRGAHKVRSRSERGEQVPKRAGPERAKVEVRSGHSKEKRSRSPGRQVPKRAKVEDDEKDEYDDAPKDPRKRSVSSDEGQKKKKKKKKKGKRNRSCSSSGSSSGSVFQDASTSNGHTSSQAKLMSWASRHPGRLMAQALQRMEDRVGRDGEAKNWSPMALPAAAKSYFLRVLKAENGTKRNLRELQTICAVIDHIAQKRYMEAGDVLMQRLKALELAMHSGNWERASFLELIESEGAPLVGKEEEFMIAKESEFHKRIHRGDPHASVAWPALYPSGGNDWQPSGKGAPWGQKGKEQWKKGKEKGKGKDKGKKGKGKDKAKQDSAASSWDW